MQTMPFTDGFLLLWSLILLGVGTLTVPSSTQTHRRPIINNQRSLARMGCTFHRRLASYLVTNLLGVGTYTVYTRQSLGVTIQYKYTDPWQSVVNDPWAEQAMPFMDALLSNVGTDLFGVCKSLVYTFIRVHWRVLWLPVPWYEWHQSY